MNNVFKFPRRAPHTQGDAGAARLLILLRLASGGAGMCVGGLLLQSKVQAVVGHPTVVGFLEAIEVPLAASVVTVILLASLSKLVVRRIAVRATSAGN